MRASELLGRRVFDADGRDLGRVMGIRSVQDGPVSGAYALLRVESLVVHKRRIGAALGYQLREQSGPGPISALMRWVHRDARLVPWTAVRDPDADRLVADVSDRRQSP